jgi:periplasmic protein TonB
MTYKSRKTASQQLTGIGFVVGLHLVGIYLVASGLAHQAVQTVMGPIETKVIEEAKPKAEELPPPPPKLQTPPPYVPPPDLDVAIEAPPPSAAPSTAISNVSNTPVKAAPTPSVPDAEARLDPRNRRNQITESDYPRQSVRLREEGIPVLSILVREDGTVGDAKLLQSCGIERIDTAALELVKRFRYSPAVKDGKPIASWKTQPVTFKLTK